MPLHFDRLILNTIAPSPLLDHHHRLAIYRAFGLNAKRAYIEPGCVFVHPNLSNITMGDRTFLNQQCYVENGAPITIGDDVCMSVGVKLLTTTHEIGKSSRRVGNTCVRRAIVIGDGVWIGAGVTVLPGVAIGRGAVIGAGAIVTRDVPNDVVAIGVPARVLRAI